MYYKVEGVTFSTISDIFACQREYSLWQLQAEHENEEQEEEKLLDEFLARWEGEE